MNAPDYFIPDRDAPAFYPLRNYLPSVAASVAEKYIDALTAPGDVVIAPFACLPTIARVAITMQRRVIAIEANPLWSWLAHALATVPPIGAIDAALAQLGDARKDDTPLRAHITQLYATTCAACQKITPADYFTRARGGDVIARHYTCAHCGATRDDPATEDDLRRANAFDARGLHYHLAFTRVAPADGAHAERIRKMLDVYTPRNLYALVTLTQKIDSLFHATREREILRLLLLHLLDRGSSFYAAPDAPAQLTAHKQFIEINLWREIETAARELGSAAPALDLATTPDEVMHAEMPGVFIGAGNARALARELAPGSSALVLAAPPTRRLAVWALSYFWGAWLLGRAAVESLTPFLDTKKDATWERRWYFNSLVGSLNALAKLLNANGRAIFAFTETWREPIEALLLAGAGAHLDLESFLFQPRLGDFPRREFDDVRGQYRIAFVPALARATEEGNLEAHIRATALAAAEEILARRGEPLAFSYIHHAAYARLAREGFLTQAMRAKFKTPPGKFVHAVVVAGLSEGYARDLDHYETREQFLWMRRTRDLAAPLLDRVEEFVARALARSLSRDELQDLVYREFPGDLTPPAGLIELCVQAAKSEGSARPFGFDHARAVLTRLGERLGYTVIADFRFRISDSVNDPAAIEKFDLVWQAEGEIAHAFVWRERARFADLAQIHIAPARGYVIVPENQVALMRAKTQCLPHLADAFHEAGWDFVRVPFAEKLLNAEKIEPSDLAVMVGLIPPDAHAHAQLELL
ncbi:MAG: hypothetical protein HZC40_04265 [Chloroflexi bacterium]|nr:hypothetical protein [Chloroflexota bacterium]